MSATFKILTEEETKRAYEEKDQEGIMFSATLDTLPEELQEKIKKMFELTFTDNRTEAQRIKSDKALKQLNEDKAE